MFYVYILYSKSADKYYIGHSDDPARRLVEHNTVIKNSYTKKYRPWELKVFFAISEERGEAKCVELYLKRMKSSKLIRRLIEHREEFDDIKVRAIPTRRD